MSEGWWSLPGYEGPDDAGMYRVLSPRIEPPPPESPIPDAYAVFLRLHLELVCRGIARADDFDLTLRALEMVESGQPFVWRGGDEAEVVTPPSADG